MKKNFAVVYGSAVTKMFADGLNFPRDIDIMTNMDHVIVGNMALRWFKRAYPEHPEPMKIPIDQIWTSITPVSGQPGMHGHM